jgi:hypothetical protein
MPAGLHYVAAINAFQQAGISDVQWNPNLLLEIGSRDYEVDALGFIVRKYRNSDRGLCVCLLETHMA